MRRGLLLASAVLAGAVWLGGTAAQAQGTIRVAISSSLNTLDPAKTKIGEEYICNFLLFSALTELTVDGKVVPDAAASWTSSEDQKTWTFKLRPGVKFHHGRELDSEDVKVTYTRILDKATGSTARAALEIIDSIDIPDKLTVVFKLKIAYSGFAEIAADRHMRILPRDALDKIASEPIGSGPFKLKSYRAGDRIELVKNPDYYAKGTPKLDAILLRIIPETAAQIAGLETGEIDLAWNMPPETVEELKKNPKLVVDAISTSSWDALIMNGNQKPFDDPRVRKAVALAMDKKALTEVALFGHGSPTHTMIPPTHAFFNKDIPIGPPDIATAKKLLAEAGHPNGFTVTLYVPIGRPTRERLGLGAQEMLKAIGIKAEIQRVPWDKFVKDIEGKAAFYTDGFFSRPTLDTSIYPWYHSSGSWNTTLWNYKNERIDKLLDAARAAKTDEERGKLYKEFQALAVADPPGVVPYVLNHVNALRTTVKGFRSHPMLILDLKQTTVQ